MHISFDSVCRDMQFFFFFLKKKKKIMIFIFIFYFYVDKYLMRTSVDYTLCPSLVMKMREK
jgi:hypothetical protein